MTPAKVMEFYLGLFAAALGSLLFLVFMSFLLGIHVGVSLGSALSAVAGVVAMVKTGHRYFFAGWLVAVAVLGAYLTVTLFVS
ncbi:hypothetical protein [Nonomuraea aridisoli]|uniref:Uncharacterized protein n=1 Tax=Nonomuraea aridisoli TaxID=2070368 RepID=A0A2W2D687_9ACTN|nr:hypothetical protein [Nonomuraea aridisoli]PZG07582.1 hypothetical protein C1J01_40350 [Nonomuraea aridisoli]